MMYMTTKKRFTTKNTRDNDIKRHAVAVSQVATEQFLLGFVKTINDADMFSAHTLLGASSELFEKLTAKVCKRNPLFKLIVDGNPHLKEKDLRDILNQRRNALKHFQGKGDKKQYQIIKNFNNSANEDMAFIVVNDVTNYFYFFDYTILAFADWYFSARYNAFAKRNPGMRYLNLHFRSMPGFKKATERKKLLMLKDFLISRRFVRFFDVSNEDMRFYFRAYGENGRLIIKVKPNKTAPFRTYR